ncbi:hypothetical protein ACFV4P_35835 [Kitasatospora sp. NPDC059795]
MYAQWEPVLAEYADRIPDPEQVNGWALEQLEAELEELLAASIG